MITQYPVLSRNEFRRQVGEGFKFEDVEIWAPDTSPADAVFVLVDLGPGQGTTFKRRLN